MWGRTRAPQARRLRPAPFLEAGAPLGEVLAREAGGCHRVQVEVESPLEEALQRRVERVAVVQVQREEVIALAVVVRVHLLHQGAQDGRVLARDAGVAQVEVAEVVARLRQSRCAQHGGHRVIAPLHPAHRAPVGQHPVALHRLWVPHRGAPHQLPAVEGQVAALHAQAWPALQSVLQLSQVIPVAEGARAVVRVQHRRHGRHVRRRGAPHLEAPRGRLAPTGEVDGHRGEAAQQRVVWLVHTVGLALHQCLQGRGVGGHHRGEEGLHAQPLRRLLQHRPVEARQAPAAPRGEARAQVSEVAHPARPTLQPAVPHEDGAHPVQPVLHLVHPQLGVPALQLVEAEEVRGALGGQYQLALHGHRAEQLEQVRVVFTGGESQEAHGRVPAYASGARRGTRRRGGLGWWGSNPGADERPCISPHSSSEEA